MAKQKNIENVTEVTTEVTTEATTEELTVIPNNQLPLVKRTYNNPELTNAVHAIGEATIKGNMERWKIAKACYDIASNNLWNKDFKSQKDFADSIGYANGTITALKNAVAFTIMHEDMIEKDEDGNIIGGITVDKADILSKVENYDEFNAYCIDHEHKEAHTIGDNKLKKIVAEYKKSLIEDKTSDTKDTNENTTDTPKATVKNVSEGKTSNVAFKDLNIGIKFEYENVPTNIVQRVCELLKPYKVAEYNKDGEKVEG